MEIAKAFSPDHLHAIIITQIACDGVSIADSSLSNVLQLINEQDGISQQNRKTILSFEAGGPPDEIPQIQWLSDSKVLVKVSGRQDYRKEWDS
jgi:hypothetical protein